MNVFISWSGERSKQVAELLHTWLQCVIQAVRPWMSTSGIDRGANWSTEINVQLSAASIGIVCLTAENVNKPWILFETGALAKGLSENRVCTFLIDLVYTDLENPLAQFNHTLPDKNSVYRLVKTINSTLKESAISDEILNSVFDTYWPQFDKNFKEILIVVPSASPVKKREEVDVLNEILQSVRSFDRRIRDVENALKPKGNQISVFDSGKIPEIQDLEDFHLRGFVTNNAISRRRAEEYVKSNIPYMSKDQLREGLHQQGLGPFADLAFEKYDL